MRRKFVLVTDGTDAGAREGLSPMGFNSLFTVLGMPFEGIPPDFALTIGISVSVCGSRCRSPRARGWFAFLADLDKPVIEHRINHNGIEDGSFDVFRTRTELLDNTFVATVKSTNEEQIIRSGGITTLQRFNSSMRPSKWDRYSRIDSFSP